jgi:hypothetical protein
MSMGLGSFLWKKSMNNVALQLNSRGYRTQLIDTGAPDANEKFKLRITSQDGFVDLYSRNRIWMFDKLDAHGQADPGRTNEVLENRRGFPFQPVPANAAPIEVADALLYGFVITPVSKT